MKSLTTAGSILFGTALVGFGIIQYATQGFLSSLLPITYLPIKFLWVNVSATLFILCGVLLILRKSISQASTVIGLLFTLFFLYLHLPRLLSQIRDPRAWTVAFETLAIAGGAWMISASRISEVNTPDKWKRLVQRAGGISRFVFAACLIVFGTQHFMYNDFIITLMPAWLPGKFIWSYLVQFGFLLAAASLLLNRWVNGSMFLLGTMFFMWVMMLHGPRSISKPADANEWASLCIALAVSGISFYIAGTAIRTYNIFEVPIRSETTDESIIST